LYSIVFHSIGPNIVTKIIIENKKENEKSFGEQRIVEHSID
jgi:hypothetical protein